MANIPLHADLDAQNVCRLRNLPSPVLDSDAANKAYVDSLFGGLAWKDNVRVATTSNINLSSAPSSIDGVTLSIGDRVLVKDQTVQTQNGIYIYNGATQAMVRSPDADDGSELTNAIVSVDVGTVNAGTQWRCISVDPIIGTDNILWASYSPNVPDATEAVKGKAQIATQAEVDAGTNDNKIVTPLKLANWANRVRVYTTTFGDSTNTQYTITHNLGRKYVIEKICRTVDDRKVECDVQYVDNNTLIVRVAQAPGNNALHITVIG